jgi:hypothetical protein
MFCSSCGLEAESGNFCIACGTSLGQANDLEPESAAVPLNPTTRENKISILSELWMTHRTDEEFEDFFEYNDISMPLAYMLESNLVITTHRADVLIDETWTLLLLALDIDADNAFTSLGQLLSLDE